MYTGYIRIKYNFRAEQRVSRNLIGRAVPYLTLYSPLQAVNITFSRPGYLARHLCHLGTGGPPYVFVV